MKETLWIGLGNSAQAWYRCALPANHLDQDWIGAYNGIPNEGGVMLTGNIQEPVIDYDKYDNIILQLVNEPIWIEKVLEWQKDGKKVFYECDDFIHGIHNIKDHKFRSAFAKKRVKSYTEIMKVCDGIICSTEFLAEQYKKYNSNVYVCENGIDCNLYDNEKHYYEDDRVIVGWSGGTGHLQAMKSWFTQVINVMSYRDNVHFLTCGANYADQVAKIYPTRSLSIPWTTIENYPFVVSGFDIAIAPSHVSKYFRSKSDLRWLEAAASGVPVIANPITYAQIQDGVTGMLAATPDEFEDKLLELVKDEELRREIGLQGKQYIQKHRDISVVKNQWSEIL
jgi:glycosyltransferase involved in cell wall biosynthesis